MKNRGSGIKIYRAEPEGRRGNRGVLPLFCLQSAVICFLMAVWWNAFLSVFRLPFDRVWLYGGNCALTVLLSWAGKKFRGKAVAVSLAAAALLLWVSRETVLELYEWMIQNYPSMFLEYTEGEAAFSRIAVLAGVPVLDLLLAVQRKGRGKGCAGLVLAAPFFAAAAAGYFQPVLPAWLLIVGAAVYFVSTDTGTGGKARNKSGYMWIRIALAVLTLSVVALVSFQAGKLLDSERGVEGGYYLRTRAAIQSEVIGGVRDLLEERTREEQPQEPSNEESVRPEQDNMAQDSQTMENPEGGNGEETPFLPADSGMDDLGSLAYFQPASGQLSTFVTGERPQDTVYVAERWGITYDDNSWSGPSQWEGDADTLESLEECRLYPLELADTLESLCAGWNGGGNGSLQEVSSEISRELSERAVYDTRPGATPAGKDFVEYFLLENQKGFCVHFATAATLMYRYCGYTSRYAEGYAIPASAFHQNESGEYEAEITGSMGHAWCQVYNEQTDTWTDMEHTPPAPEGEAGQPPATDSVRERSLHPSSERSGRLFGFLPVWVAAVFGIAAVGTILFFLQAAVRSARRKQQFHRKSGGEGIRRMYGAVLETARFQGMEVQEALGENTAEQLAGEYPELKKEEWEWMYSCVMESMFYHLDDEKKAWEQMKGLYTRFRKAAYKRMKRRERWRYRYVCCLG